MSETQNDNWQHLREAVTYFIQYAGPMVQASDEVKASSFSTLTRFPRDFKGGYFAISEAMRLVNHPDTELFNGYSQAQIFGGFYYHPMNPVDFAEAQDQEQYLDYMVEALSLHPQGRFIPFEKKAEWQSF